MERNKDREKLIDIYRKRDTERECERMRERNRERERKKERKKQSRKYVGPTIIRVSTGTRAPLRVAELRISVATLSLRLCRPTS